MKTRSYVVKRIYQLIDEKQYTINGLARNAGLAPTTLKNILNGRSNNPGIVTIKIICDGLDISLADFFNTEDFRNLEQEIE